MCYKPILEKQFNHRSLSSLIEGEKVLVRPAAEGTESPVRFGTKVQIAYIVFASQPLQLDTLQFRPVKQHLHLFVRTYNYTLSYVGMHWGEL